MTTQPTAAQADIPRLQNCLAQADGIMGILAQAHGTSYEDQANALWAARSLLEECRTIARHLSGAETATTGEGQP